MRRPRKFCRKCGQRMGRHAELLGFDSSSGVRRWRWWWACRARFWGWADEENGHDGRRIRTSGARRRLEAW